MTLTAAQMRKWPEVRRAHALEGGRAYLLRRINEAPSNVRRAVFSELAGLSKSHFYSPFQSWGAAIGILERHLPDLADEARLFIAELAASECDSTE